MFIYKRLELVFIYKRLELVFIYKRLELVFIYKRLELVFIKTPGITVYINAWKTPGVKRLETPGVNVLI